MFCSDRFLCPTFSRHPLSPLRRIDKQLSKFVIFTFSNSSITPQHLPLLPKVLPIFSNSDRQPQAEAENAFKNLKVGKLRA
jgi:hypothetical protein